MSFAIVGADTPNGLVLLLTQGDEWRLSLPELVAECSPEELVDLAAEQGGDWPWAAVDAHVRDLTGLVEAEHGCDLEDMAVDHAVVQRDNRATPGRRHPVVSRAAVGLLDSFEDDRHQVPTGRRCGEHRRVEGDVDGEAGQPWRRLEVQR